MIREIIEQFQGKEKVIHIISDNGSESYLTQSRSFDDEAVAIGATKLNTIENEKKHVLFFFNSDDEEVGRYYLGKKLQGKTPEQLVEIKHGLVFFESWNPETKLWVPCVSIDSSHQLAQPSVSISKERDTLLNNSSNMKPNKEILKKFKGKSDVIHLLNGNNESWITRPEKITIKIRELNAEMVMHVESKDKKVHYLCLVDSNNNLLGKYILDNKLYNKKDDWFSCEENLDQLEVFDCYVQSSDDWISCVKYNSAKEYKSACFHKPIVKEQKPPFPPEKESIESTSKFEYTEEMYKQEIADQEEKDLLEYGTTDKEKIAQIEKNKKDNRNFWIFIIIVGIVIYMFMGLIQKCTGSKYNPLEDNRPWEPRHTQLYKHKEPYNKIWISAKCNSELLGSSALYIMGTNNVIGCSTYEMAV